MDFKDTPKIWVDDTNENEIYDNTTQLMPVEEVVPLPTVQEQHNMLAQSTLSDEDKGILGGIIEVNKVCQLLDQIKIAETTDKRQAVLNVYAENFIMSHLRNNIRAETLKDKLLQRLADHIDDLDLELTSRIFLDLQQTMAPDVAIMNARSQGDSGMNAAMGNGPSINLTVNNATTEGASITNNTLAVNNNLQQLKDVTSLNYAMKNMQKIQMPRQKSELIINQNE